MWGLVHSTFLMTPVIFTGLVSSNSAAKEWCAASGANAARARHAASARRVLMGASPFDTIYYEILSVLQGHGLGAGGEENLRKAQEKLKKSSRKAVFGDLSGKRASADV